MQNICIPNPTLYRIEYTDNDGNKTTRVIVPISQNTEEITAYCYKASGIRSFKKEKIEAITSTNSREE